MNELIHNRLFMNLLLAHLIGDFVFQIDFIYKLKRKNFLGILIHSLIVSLTSFVFLIFFNISFLNLFIICFTLFATHAIIDYFKVKNSTAPFLFVIDQILHLSVIILIVFFAEKYLNVRIVYSAFLLKNLCLLNVLIIITYLVNYLVLNITGYYKMKTIENAFYIHLGSVERVLIFILAYMHGFYFLFIPIALVPRLLFAIKNQNEAALYDILISMLFSSFLGIYLRQLTLQNPFSFLYLILFSLCFLIIINLALRDRA